MLGRVSSGTSLYTIALAIRLSEMVSVSHAFLLQPSPTEASELLLNQLVAQEDCISTQPGIIIIAAAIAVHSTLAGHI